MEKRMGRPYSSGVKKNGRCELRTTPDEEEKLNYLCKKLGKSKADILRLGLEMVYNNVK